jgi:hypothetical protein
MIRAGLDIGFHGPPGSHAGRGLLVPRARGDTFVTDPGDGCETMLGRLATNAVFGAMLSVDLT